MRRALFFVGSMAVCGAFAAFAGCSSFDSAAPIAEGGLDAPIDQAIVPEAEVEADAPDAALTFCQTVDAAFCEDFESATALDASFIVYQDHGTVSLTEPGAPASPLHCIRGVTFADDAGAMDGGGATIGAVIGRPLAVLPEATMTIDADVRIVAAATAGMGTLIYALALSGPDPDDRAIFFSAGPGGVAVVATPGQSDAGLPEEANSPANITLGTWFHAHLEIHRGASSFVSVEIDGTSLLSLTTYYLDELTALTLTAGAAASAGPAANAVDVDNLVFNSY